ncbi:MAG: tyrosine-type recombinase/integrase [Nitrososphaerales archaeon]
MQATDTLILNEQSQTVKTLFDQFTKELRYLRNLSERTIFSYTDAFERWLKFVGTMPTPASLSQFVLGMREAGLSITSCNIYIRSINSFLTWLKENGHCPQTFMNGKPFRLTKLPEEKKQLRVFDDADIHKILSFKPKGRNDHRIYALVCTLIDTGIRINEALNLELARVDFDNLMITVTKGKGKKERIVPMSLDLRKILHRYVTNHRKAKFDSPFLFCTLNGTHLSHRNAMRDFENMLAKVGVSKDNIDHCFHSFRRKFARSYIKNGGNIAYLQHAMGHTTLAMTKHYIGDIPIEDLQMMHQKTSLLGRLKY